MTMDIPPIQPLPAPAPSGEYEFTEAQNAVIDRLASRMLWAGVVQIVFGAMQLVGNCTISTANGLKFTSTSSPFYIAIIVIGSLLVASSKAFRRIVRTQGNDIAHLMTALNHLSKAVFAELVTFIVLAVLMVLMILLLIVALLIFASLLKALMS